MTAFFRIQKQYKGHMQYVGGVCAGAKDTEAGKGGRERYRYMKKTMWHRAVMLLVCLAASGFLMVSLLGRQEQNTDQDWIRITAVLPHKDYGYWSIMGEGILAGGKEYGADVKIVIPRMNYDIAQMTQLIRQETAARVDALIVQGIEDQGYLEALGEAQAQGILIVLVDTDVVGIFPHLYVGTDNYAAGMKMGEAVAAVTGGQGTIAVLSGAENYPNLEERYDGICKALEQYPDLTVACLEYDQYDSLRVMEKYHTIAREYPEVDTLVCVEGTSGQTLGTRLTGETRKFSHILVFDLVDETMQGLRSGAFEGIMEQQQANMGRISVCEIIRYMESGGQWDRKILTDVNLVTAEGSEDT
jgi:ABC-type sugar transport system substrate-binding protein